MTVARVAMRRPLRGLRIRRHPEAGGAAATDPRAAELLALRDAAERAEQRHAQLEACVGRLRESAAALPELVKDHLREVAALSVEVGLAVAAEVVGDAVARGAVDPTPAVARCLAEVVTGSAGGQVEVRLHPEDLSLVMAELEREPSLRAQVESTRFVPDPALARAAVRVETATGRLAYDHAEVLRRVSDSVRKELGLPRSAEDGAA